MINASHDDQRSARQSMPSMVLCAVRVLHVEQAQDPVGLAAIAAKNVANTIDDATIGVMYGTRMPTRNSDCMRSRRLSSDARMSASMSCGTAERMNRPNVLMSACQKSQLVSTLLVVLETNPPLGEGVDRDAIAATGYSTRYD